MELEYQTLVVLSRAARLPVYEEEEEEKKKRFSTTSRALDASYYVLQFESVHL